MFAADAELVRKAKAEGQVSLYANMTAIQPIMDMFNAVTGLKGKYTRISTSKFLPTVLTKFQGGFGCQYLFPAADDPCRGAPRLTHHLSHPCAGHGFLRYRAEGVLQSLRGHHPAHPAPSDPARAETCDPGRLYPVAGSQPGFLCRALGYRYARANLRPGHPHLPV